MNSTPNNHLPTTNPLSSRVAPDSPEARLFDLDQVRSTMEQQFHLHQEITALPPGDRDALFRILWDAQNGDPSALEAIYELVYDEIPVPMDEFILGKRYLGLEGQINQTKVDLLVAFDQPQVRKGWLAIGSGGGKDLALDTPIPTPFGWTTMGDLKVGDVLFDERYMPCRVVATSPVYDTNPCVKVTFRRTSFQPRTEIVTGEGHLWCMAPRQGRAVPKWPETHLLTSRQLAESVDQRWTIPHGRVRAAVKSVAGVDHVPTVPTKCIQVDSSSHLYLASEHCIPTHNSFMVSIAKARIVYQLLCLKKPDLYYMLGPGSKIAAINLSVSKEQAKDVIYAEFLARVRGAPWFKGKFYRPLTSKCRFKKNVYVMSGGSAAVSYFGYHTIFGSLDEASFLLDRQDRSVAEELCEALLKSLMTRFPMAYKLFVVSTLRSAGDFLSVNIERVKEEGVLVAATQTVTVEGEPPDADHPKLERGG